MTPTMTPGVATNGLTTVTTALIIIFVLLLVAMAVVLLGMVLLLILRRKTVRGKQATPATGVETLYDEVDEGQTSTAGVLRSVGKLQITYPDPLYEAMDDSELVTQCVSNFQPSLNVPTASNETFGVTNILPYDDVPTDPNAAYGVTCVLNLVQK